MDVEKGNVFNFIMYPNFKITQGKSNTWGERGY